MSTRELTKEEADALTKDMMEVLEKHGAEMGVLASIQLLKREEEILSPYNENGESNNTTEETPKID